MPFISALWRLCGVCLFVWVSSLANVAAQSGVSCLDKDVNCRGWANQGLCLSQASRMTLICPDSCNICRRTPLQQPQVQPQQILPPLLQPQPQLLAQPQVQPQTQPLLPARPQPQLLAQPQVQPQAQPLLPTRPQPQLQQRRTIANPEFECGRPYPRKTNGREIRIRRQTQRAPQNQNGNFGLPQRGNIGSTSTSPGFFNREASVTDAFCGSTVISPRFLLTAAHCVLNPDKPVRTVRVGELDFSKHDEPYSRPVDYAVEKIIVHPAYNPKLSGKYNDVALIKTVVPIEFNEITFPMCVSDFRPTDNTLVTATGFANLNATYQSPVLQKADLGIISNSDCEVSYRQNDVEPVLKSWYPLLLQGKDVLCAHYPGRGTCEGDAGGPLFFDGQNGRQFLVGISSGGLACRGGKFVNLPSIFTSVADHIPFIDSVLYE